MSDSLQLHGLLPTKLLCPWDSLGKNTGVDFHALLQGIFPTQGLNLGLPHCRQILYHLSHQGSPRMLEWVTCPFSRGSSRHRDPTGVSCIAGGFLPAEPQGKPKNTVVGSLSLLQGIFLTQESNRGLLHCRQIFLLTELPGKPQQSL